VVVGWVWVSASSECCVFLLVVGCFRLFCVHLFCVEVSWETVGWELKLIVIAVAWSLVVTILDVDEAWGSILFLVNAALRKHVVLGQRGARTTFSNSQKTVRTVSSSPCHL
jgi:hypothetical protein